jgi:hypothetical protein
MRSIVNRSGRDGRESIIDIYNQDSKDVPQKIRDGKREIAAGLIACCMSKED